NSVRRNGDSCGGLFRGARNVQHLKRLKPVQPERILRGLKAVGADGSGIGEDGLGWIARIVADRYGAAVKLALQPIRFMQVAGDERDPASVAFAADLKAVAEHAANAGRVRVAKPARVSRAVRHLGDGVGLDGSLRFRPSAPILQAEPVAAFAN